MNWELQMYKLDLEKAEEERSTCLHSLDHRKSNGIPKIIYICFIDYAEAFDWVGHIKLWKILEKMGISDCLPVSWETCMQANKQQLELDMKQQTGSKLEKSMSRL